MIKNNFDIAVIGAGPAGLIAAGRAAELGKRVLLVEKNEKPGRKLLLAGNGRCNITNAEFDLRKLVENYGENGKFLFRAFSVFGPKNVINFFKNLGLETKTEKEKKVFPLSDKSEDALKALMKYLTKNKVDIIYNSRVIGVEHRDNKIKKMILKNGEITAKNYIFCVGGKSYPSTGSTGDGFKWANDLGHQIRELSPALVPIKIEENWIRELRGLSLKNIKISVFQNPAPEQTQRKIGIKKYSKFGECLFTHFGLSGPIILDISKKVGELLKNGKVKISLDLKPTLDFEKLDEKIQKNFKKYQNKAFKNSLADLLPRKLIPVIIKLSNVNPEKKVNKITREERRDLAKLLKGLEMTAIKLLGFDSAIATKGGISLKEIDDKTMRSKIINNLFFAGEIIDIDGPTGGFNLQACWSTGYLAGENAAK